MDDLRNCALCVKSIHRLGGGLPDILVGDPLSMRNYIFEVKMPGEKLNALEQKFFDEWWAQRDMIYSTEDALRVIGRL